jgi:hypothetical protein
MIKPKNTRTSTTLVIGIFATTLVIGAIFCGRDSSSANNSMPATETKLNQPLEYHIWRVFPEDRKGFTVIVASVNPKHFNRDDMTALAKELNKKFQEKSKLKVGLLDDENVARLFATGRAEYSTYEASERGRYYLDRSVCREYVQFSSERGKPRQTVKLDCGR